MEPAPTDPARSSPAAGRRPLDVARLRSGVVSTAGMWRALDVVEVTGSTNTDLLERAHAGGDIVGSVLVAEHQTAGRGRRGRRWSAVPGAQLLVSVGVAADGVPGDAWGWLPLAAGLAVVDTAAAAGVARAVVKWPNDVLVDGRKLAGTLCEVAAPHPVVVVGIGVNVSFTGGDLDRSGGVSLHELTEALPDREVLLATLLAELQERIVRWQRYGVDPAAIDDYRRRCDTLGRRVRIDAPDGTSSYGLARDIDGAGRLVVVDHHGRRDAVSAGDVVHLRDADPRG